MSHQLQWLQHWMAGYTQMQALSWWGREPYTQHGRPMQHPPTQFKWISSSNCHFKVVGAHTVKVVVSSFLHSVISETSHTLPFSQLRTQDLKGHPETGKKKASSQAVAMATLSAFFSVLTLGESDHACSGKRHGGSIWCISSLFMPASSLRP